MEPKKESAVDAFFNSLPDQDNTRADIFDEGKPQAPAAVTTTPEKGEGEGEGGEGGEPRKNRRHRRLEEKLQSEREANIALAERVKVLAEVGKVSRETEIDPRLVRAFGATEDGKPTELTRLMNDIILDNRDQAKTLALKEFESRQAEAQKKQAEFDKFVGDELEYLEDQYKTDLTSDAPAARKARREFLELVQKVSPKDDNGEITGWADFDTTFDLYQKTKSDKAAPSSVEKQKEIAARTMQRPGSGQGEPPQPTPGFFGWKKDLRIR